MKSPNLTELKLEEAEKRIDRKLTAIEGSKEEEEEYYEGRSIIKLGLNAQYTQAQYEVEVDPN